MRGTRPTILFFSPADRKVPDFLARWVEGKGLTVLPVPEPAEVEQRVLRSLPALVVIDADGGPQGLQLCARLKADSYSAIVPLAVLTDLVASGVPVDSAAHAVVALASRTRDADLIEFRRAVERDIALGAPPAAATAAAAGLTAQSVDVNAGARQQRPGRP